MTTTRVKHSVDNSDAKDNSFVGYDWENIPSSYKVGRDAQLQLSSIERNLFTDMEEKEIGNYVISGLSKQVTELDFTAFSFAVGQILYNQSYQSGNLDTNSGRTKTKSTNLTEKTKADQYSGDIVTSLNDLCKLAYGVDSPDSRQKKVMATLVETLDSTPVLIKFPNGDTLESKLCATMDRYTRKEDGAIFYNLFLNPIFCSNVKSNFGELPQDILQRLSLATTRKTTADYRLIRLLSIQRKDKPVVRTIGELISELGLYEGYKKNKGRVEKQLLSTCDNMQKIGMIDRYSAEYATVRNKKSISKVTFYLSSRSNMLNDGRE